MFRLLSPWLSLLELILPETCVGCGRVRGTVPWFAADLSGPGLRPVDAPHLCARCFENLPRETGICRELVLPGAAPVPVLAGQWTDADLVKRVAAWKYHGVRGMVAPLARHLAESLAAGDAFTPGTAPQWVPIPLHRRRARERGFNQAVMLAHQLALHLGGEVVGDALLRCRNTGQQAKLKSASDRARNLQNAFLLGQNRDRLVSGNIVLVDDLVTTGATAGALAALLNEKGLRLKAVVCLGLARPAG